jgi:hypothetical protein
VGEGVGEEMGARVGEGVGSGVGTTIDAAACTASGVMAAIVALCSFDLVYCSSTSWPSQTLTKRSLCLTE